ncbi:MAG: sigma 54-interacting transcriptional regulator [Planctomycetaceae bacterium]|jgi:Nif-specific regulatory protein|nr:sigma 54-interacting transcriptional regulator [Planctomycetaceae bacterium]
MDKVFLDSRRALELEAVLSLSRLIGSELDQRNTLSETLNLLHSQLDMTRGIILLVTPDKEGLILEVAHGITSYQKGKLTYQRGEGIVGQVIETGRSIAIPKISEEPMFLDRIYNRRKKISEEISFICVPIVCENEVLGTLSVDKKYEGDNAGLDHDVQILKIVASMIAYDVKIRRQNAEIQSSLEAENIRLKEELLRFRPENLVGNSMVMRDVYQAIYQVAPSDATVLIRGESGTGKELAAAAIHNASNRKDAAFVRVNCAALNENLLESELFGHEKGAFTGAISLRKGRVEEAEGGTLFLDEIGDFSLSIQVKILRLLQERTYERVGSSTTRRANVRLICATNRNLEEAMAQGTFREDLYYRINVFPIVLPPLRDRRSDIVLLANHFIETNAKRMNKDIKQISAAAVDLMLNYRWPGNVRELENTIERAILLSHNGMIYDSQLPQTLQRVQKSSGTSGGTAGCVTSLKDRVEAVERPAILEALKRTKGNMAAAALELGTTPRILRYKVFHYGIDPKKEEAGMKGNTAASTWTVYGQ